MIARDRPPSDPSLASATTGEAFGQPVQGVGAPDRRIKCHLRWWEWVHLRPSWWLDLVAFSSNHMGWQFW